jgi:NitT/TauT family transport system substrate-binding protein
MRGIAKAALLTACSFVLVCCSQRPSPGRLRLGFFPTLTHAAALVGIRRGDFQRALGSTAFEVKAFAAGPEAMEALFAGAIDAGYVGPMPALNGYLRSQGRALKIVAGAASGGAGFVVRRAAHIERAEDLHRKRLASPELGNTQDLALRLYLAEQGLNPREVGGDVQMVPVANADILQLMKSNQIDGAWVPEPWLTRLIHEAGGRLFLDERERWPSGRFATAVLVVSRRLLDERPDVAMQLVAAHVAVVRWIRAHPDEARAAVGEEIKARLGKALSAEELVEAFGHVEVTYDPLVQTLDQLSAGGRRLGYLPREPSIEGILDHRILDAALARQPARHP